jgi:O-antigen ligase
VTPASAAAVAAPATRRSDALAFGLAVLIVLTYSQGWVAPLSGYRNDPAAGGLIRALYYPAYLAGFLLLVGGPGASARAVLRAPLLIALVGLAAASTVWSVDPSATSRRVVALTFTSLGGVALAARFDWPRLASVFATAFAALAGVSLLLGLLVPDMGRMTELFVGAWRGVWFEKNSFGGNMAVGFVVFVAAAVLVPERRRLWAGCAGLALLLVLLSTSKTSLLGLLLGGAAVAFVALMKRGPATAVVTVWLAVASIAGLAAVVVFASDAVFALLGKDATLTGRTEIWTAVTRRVHERPRLGWGYGAIWDSKDVWNPYARITREAGFPAHHAHSSWVEMALGLGVTGLSLWALWWLEAWGRALAGVVANRGAWLAAPFLLVHTLTSLTESVTLTWNDLRWVMFVAVAVKLALGEAGDQPAAARASSARP